MTGGLGVRVSEFLLSRARLLRGLGLALGICGLIGGVLVVSPYSLAYNRTPSIPMGVYLTKRVTSDVLVPGDIGCFAYRAPEWAQDRSYFPSGMRLCKYVYGRPGTAVFRDGDALWVGERAGPPVAHYSDADSKGRPLYQDALATGVVPAGTLLMLAPARKNSFDSRYLGYIPAEDVRTQAWPLWTQ